MDKSKQQKLTIAYTSRINIPARHSMIYVLTPRSCVPWQVCDNIWNIAPCGQMVMGEPAFLSEEFNNTVDPDLELVTTSGYGKNGALSILQVGFSFWKDNNNPTLSHFSDLYLDKGIPIFYLENLSVNLLSY